MSALTREAAEQAIASARVVWSRACAAAGNARRSPGPRYDVGVLVDEVLRAERRETGREEALRTLDDVGGHFEDGVYIGAERIVEASRLLRAFARTEREYPPEWAARKALAEMVRM